MDDVELREPEQLGGEMVTELDWSFALDSDLAAVLGCLALAFTGFYVLGGDNLKSPLGATLGIWNGANFGLVALFSGFGLFFVWLAMSVESGAIDWSITTAGYFGIAGIVCLTIAGGSLVMLEVGPAWLQNWIGLAVTGLLFCQSLSSSLWVDWSGEFVGMDFPAWPMNEVLSSFLVIIHAVAGAVLFASLINNQRDDAMN